MADREGATVIVVYEGYRGNSFPPDATYVPNHIFVFGPDALAYEEAMARVSELLNRPDKETA